ncbi:MAG: hypothetical protein MJZ53_00160 [Paludibacteraceae bacterium]|nr:hypothetical protein [Paludibacteraceae bacterium]
MKKIFTFIFVSVLALSCWGTEYQVGNGTHSTDNHVPMSFGAGTGYSLSQQIYTSEELLAAGMTEGLITEIQFCYANTSAYERTWEVYITKPMKSSKEKSNYQFAEFYSAGDLAFSGKVNIPSTKTWYKVKLDTPYAWDGESNIMITINDITGTTISFSRYDSTYVVSDRGVYIYNSSSPYNIANIGPLTPTKSSSIPKIKFTIGSDAPVATPTLTLDKNSVNLGTLDAQYETVEQTFVVKGSDLTNDVTISAATGLQVSPSSITKEDIATAGDAGVQVTVSNTSAFTYNSPQVTVSSTDAVSKQLTVTGTVAAYSDKSTINFLKNAGSNTYCTLSVVPTISAVDASNKIITISKLGTIDVDYSLVDGSYAVNGTISNLKGKLINEHLFKAFAFNYTAPVVTGITIDENADNSAVLATNDGQSVTVNFTRSLTQGMYNTICLPIALNEAFLESTFGTSCSLISLASSTYEDGVITLNFEEERELEAGKPYLVKPTKVVTNPVFNSWLVSAELHPVETTYADFIPVFSPTVLEQSKSILFLGADNELFWPTEAGTIKGLRCYFRVHVDDSPIPSGAPVRMVIGRGTPTDISQTADKQISAQKVIENGHIFIERNGVRYNLNGQIVK